MNGALIATMIFPVLAVIEGFNGLRLAFRARRTLESVGLRYEEGPRTTQRPADRLPEQNGITRTGS